MGEVVAALDCGSNSTRLLIAGPDGATWRRETRITRLSEGVDATGSLRPEAMERTFAVLDAYHDMMSEAGVARGLLVATSAVRDAANGAEFLEGARRHARVDARILTGAEEAAFSYAGATADLDPAPVPTVVLDIGGGSSELAVVLDGRVHGYSMQLGCVRVTERALGRDVVTPARAAAARAMIDAEIARAWAAEPVFARLAGHLRLVGLAGTVATLAQLDAGEAQYRRETVHHRTITRETVRHWRDLLSAQSPLERLARPGMVAGREDVMPAGLFVLDEVMGRLGVDELVSSENDILDGVAAALRDDPRAPRWRT